MSVRAVIFDMDGLMFDTENLVRRSWDMAGAAIGYEGFGDNIFFTLGKGERDRKEYFKEKYGADFPYEQFKADYYRFFREEVRQRGVPVKPGLYELLEYLRKRGIRAAVATSSSRESAMDKLTRTGTEQYFCRVVGGDMVLRAKPDPEIYLTAFQLLEESERLERGCDLARDEALVLEDSENGLRSALAAGIPAIMIPDLIQSLPELEPKLAAKLPSLDRVIGYIEDKF